MNRIVPLILVGVLLTASSVHSDETRSSPDRPVIPVVRLSGMITEKPVPDDMPFTLGGDTGVSLHSLLSKLSKIENDDSVPAVVLEIGTVAMGRAQREALVRSVNKLRTAGKKVHVHVDQFTTRDLPLIAHADEVSMVPTGYMFINGLYGEQIFLRGLLDKLGVEPDYLTCGDYKSAGEMFMRNEPSEEAARMYNWLYDGIWGNTVDSIAKGRSVSKEKVQNWVDEGVYTAERAVKEGIIDVVEHHHEFEARLKKSYGENLRFNRRYGRKAGNQIDLSSPFGLMNFYAELLAPSTPRKSTKPGVGIVYLEGSILPGSSGGNPFLADAAAFSDTIRKALDEAADDDAIKAVVFRVNSPGGSAVASEIILNAAKRVAAKKPLIVSMGDVAASGGYYVACGTDTIFAENSTVTGSIGVVSGKFATTKMWDKLGINFSPIKRGKNAGILSSAGVFSDSERSAMQGFMDEVYEVFKGHVTNIRGKRLKKPIDEIAGGRVYTGRQALELGLVDRIGGLNEAIALAADKASLKTGYDVRVVPRPKNFMELLMGDLNGPKDDGRHLRVGQLTLPSALEAAIPLLNGLDATRVNAIKHALLQLTVLQQEKVTLTMPIVTQ